MFEKNKSGQSFTVFAFDATTGDGVEGDEANITCKIRKDFGSFTATNDANPTALEGGYYDFDYDLSETNSRRNTFIAESTTPNVQVVVLENPDFSTTEEILAWTNSTGAKDHKPYPAPGKMSLIRNATYNDSTPHGTIVLTEAVFDLTAYNGNTGTYYIKNGATVEASQSFTVNGQDLRLELLAATTKDLKANSYTFVWELPLTGDDIWIADFGLLLLNA